MKGLCLCFFLGLLAISNSAIAQTSGEKVTAAQKAAESWLVLIDGDKYGESWEQAAETFRSAVAKEKWEGMVGSVRDQIGKSKSRKLIRAEYTTKLPNAPAGEYVLIQYDSSFEKADAAIETIVPMREKNGEWKVSGYFVKPKQ
ncbi:MAG TPA: DUF4019 domain-containing protein [Bryobacteraceae bacterium]|nr:DUF4019 domain-containing protein [Bryobacteraceae bacterium]